VWDAALRHAESLNRLAITSGAGVAAGQVSGGKGVYDLPEGLLAMMPERYESSRQSHVCIPVFRLSLCRGTVSPQIVSELKWCGIFIGPSSQGRS
jgi:hypothetical protein